MCLYSHSVRQRIIRLWSAPELLAFENVYVTRTAQPYKCRQRTRKSTRCTGSRSTAPSGKR